MASELPSQTTETLAVCPRFRIVIVGNTGVGKSSLISAVSNIVFNTSLPDVETGAIDIANDRIGRTDINYAYYSDQNPRFVLHDSVGFEPGSTDQSKTIKSFLQDRAELNAKLSDQVHAIWLCIETPRTGSRLLQTGDEDLLQLAKQLNIPIIVVFTKYDLLVMEHFRASRHISSLPDRKVEAKKRAEKAFDQITRDLQVASVPISMKTEYRGSTLLKLTQVTGDHLRDVSNSLWVLWVTTQQINARLKVKLSISEGCKKYWRDLGESVFFQGHPLGDCIARIHDDILIVWNFNDPLKLLSGVEFLEGMLRLVEPLRDVPAIENQHIDGIVGQGVNAVTVVDAVSNSLILPALETINGTMEFQFLRNNYQKGASTGIYLASYIVDLILVLYEISMAVAADPPTSLSRDLVMNALATYKLGSDKIHNQVKDVAFSPKLEERIAKVIQDAVRM